MARTISIGRQDFEKLRVRNNFYVDKTRFIKEWWEADDEVTLIARPRRFGKTLNLSTLEKFFSTDYAGRSELFEGLSIWEDKKYQALQGTYPVIFLSFADVEASSFSEAPLSRPLMNRSCTTGWTRAKRPSGACYWPADI